MVQIGFPSPRPAQMRRLNRVQYAAGLRMQKACAEYVKEPGRPDQILVLEHNPVFTLGRNATRADIHVTEEFLAQKGVEVHEIDRGGQVTYHGPGQIVVYPICNLRGGREDVGRLVRGLEEAMLRTAAEWGISCYRIPEFPGVWVDTERGPEKLGALGIHLSRWITTHGIAFNVDPFLPHFRWITPCGITDKGVCSFRSLLGEGAPTWSTVADRLEHHLAEVMGFELQPVTPPSQSISALTWRRGASGPEVLMMLRQPDQGLWWSSVTGMLEPGETHEQGALRELQEEAGLSGTLRSLDFNHSFWVDPKLLGWLEDAEPRFNTETCFEVEVAADAEVKLDRREHSDYRWCNLEEALDLAKWEGAKAAMRLLRERLGA